MIVLGVLVSGSGTNLQAILGAIAARTLDARVAVVVSNVEGAPALERARAAGVETVVIDHTRFPDRRPFDEAVVAVLRERGVETVVLAGFMRLVTDVLLEAFPARVINVHPSILPAFPGRPFPAASSRVRRPGLRLHGSLRRRRDGQRPGHCASRRPCAGGR